MSALIVHRQHQRRLHLLCTAAALLLIASSAVLAQPDAPQSLERLQQLAEQTLRAQLPASAEVQADAIDPRLQLPACAAPQAEAAPARGASVSVALRCTAPAWTVYVPVRVRDLREVLVLDRPVRAGELPSAPLFRRERRDVALLPFGYLLPDALPADQEFRRSLAAGTVPTPADLQPGRCVRRGELVQLISRVGGLEVRAGGKALADGAKGQRIRVENSQSRRIVEGTVTGAGVVEL